MGIYELKTPFLEEDVRKLRIGDQIYLSGDVFTGRSRIHRWCFDEEHPLLFETQTQNAMIHVGPIMKQEEDGWQLISFMPTSSLRFEKWGARAVREWGLRAIIGKTTMGQATMDAMKQYGCIHASPQCVSPNLWRDSIKIRGVELLEELGSIEASWQLSLDRLGPFIVDIDCTGANYFEAMDRHVAEVRDSVLQSMGVPKDFEPTKLY